MIARSLLLFVALHACGWEFVLRRLRSRLEVGEFEFHPEFSGRTALLAVGAGFRERARGKVALIPDYICNVVQSALEQAGLEVCTYSTDDAFEPDEEEITALVSSGKVGVLVTANVFGSSALLGWLKRDRIRDLIRSTCVHVIVDLCQDISLVRELPEGYGEQLAAVVSFNDKSFFGVLGGGILAQQWKPVAAGRLSWRLTTALYRMLWSKVRAHIRSACPSDKRVPNVPSSKQFEYSYCADFPYTLERRQPAKLQLILALIGLGNLAELHRTKAAQLRNLPVERRPRYLETSPYVVCNRLALAEIPRRRKIKGSYAIHREPGVSARPELLIVHNKGYCDE
jgi:hypothetical protein